MVLLTNLIVNYRTGSRGEILRTVVTHAQLYE